jgi:hypothetical protein
MAAVTAGPTLATQGGPAWIQSPAWDLFWMFSALWGAALLCLGAFFVDVVTMGALLAAIGPLVAIGHAWSTTYMMLGSPLLADERRARPRKYVLYPALIVVGCMALGLVVAYSQRFPEDGRLTAELWPWMLYIGLLWVGHFWHFGNQDFGVLTIYRQKAGQNGLWDRRVDKLYTGIMMFVIQPIVHVNFVTTTAFGEIVGTYLPFGRTTLQLLTSGALVAACLLFVAVVAFELGKPNRSIPKLLYDTVILAHPILLALSIYTKSFGLAYAYLISYLWSHWIIAIGLVARINVRYGETQGLSPPLAIVRHASTLGMITGAAAIVFSIWGGYHLFNTDRMAYKDVLASITPEAEPVVGLVFGFFLCEQILHYYCDRCLFRFRDEGVRRRVAPLLL